MGRLFLRVARLFGEDSSLAAENSCHGRDRALYQGPTFKSAYVALTIGSAACPKPRLIVERVQNGRRVALAGTAFDADAGGRCRLIRQATVEKKLLAQGNFPRSLWIVRRDRGASHFNRRPNLLKRLRLG
jgi:hypothetical protein